MSATPPHRTIKLQRVPHAPSNWIGQAKQVYLPLAPQHVQRCKNNAQNGPESVLAGSEMAPEALYACTLQPPGSMCVKDVRTCSFHSPLKKCPDWRKLPAIWSTPDIVRQNMPLRFVMQKKSLPYPCVTSGSGARECRACLPAAKPIQPGMDIKGVCPLPHPLPLTIYDLRNAGPLNPSRHGAAGGPGLLISEQVKMVFLESARRGGSSWYSVKIFPTICDPKSFS